MKEKILFVEKNVDSYSNEQIVAAQVVQSENGFIVSREIEKLVARRRVLSKRFVSIRDFMQEAHTGVPKETMLNEIAEQIVEINSAIAKCLNI